MHPGRLTTTEAAALASVAVSTLKRWADEGVVPFIRTAGGHRRFERGAIDRLVAGQIAAPSAQDQSWARLLLERSRYEVEGRLLEARGRLGAWHAVADEVAIGLGELGTLWELGRITIADEHLASDKLVRALARVADALPTRVDGPRALLATAPGDEHTLSLSLAELCLRELGWTPMWLGRATPVAEVVQAVTSGRVALVVLSAAASSRDKKALGQVARQVAAACRSNRVGLVVGGAGAWPAALRHGVRLTSFAALHQHLLTTARDPIATKAPVATRRPNR